MKNRLRSGSPPHLPGTVTGRADSPTRRMRRTGRSRDRTGRRNESGVVDQAGRTPRGMGRQHTTEMDSMSVTREQRLAHHERCDEHRGGQHRPWRVRPEGSVARRRQVGLSLRSRRTIRSLIDTASGEGPRSQVKVEGENPEHAVFSLDSSGSSSVRESQVVDVIRTSRRRAGRFGSVGKRTRARNWLHCPRCGAYVACELPTRFTAIRCRQPEGARNDPGRRPAPTASRCIRRRARSMSQRAGGTSWSSDTATDKVSPRSSVGNRPWNMALTTDGDKLLRCHTVDDQIQSPSSAPARRRK